MTLRLTYDGYDLMLKAMNGKGITFTKISLGNGEKPDDYEKLETMMNQVVDIDLDSITEGEQYITLKGTLDSGTLAAGFTWTETGIYAANPAGGSDILYGYGHYQVLGEGEEAENPSYVAKSKTTSTELTVSASVFVGDLEDISAILSTSPTYATKAELEAHLSAKNPHNLTKDDLGLDQVENKALTDQTPTYETPTELSEPVSGEKVGVLLGKLKLGISKLIAHLKDSTVHITGDERSAWNEKADGTHTHAASDISSGTLAVARGGTGAATLTSGGILLGKGTSAVRALSGIGAVYASTSGSPQFGTLPVAQGGTGAATLTSGGILLGKGTDAVSALSGIGAVYASTSGSPQFGTLPVAQGGTGKSSWTANRLAYPSAAATFSQLSFPTKSGMYLRQNTSGAPYWGECSETGVYTGQGRSGSDEKNSITFSGGLPKIVIVQQRNSEKGRHCVLLLNSSSPVGYSVVDGVSSDLVVSTSSNTVYWYYESTDSHPANQLDTQGATHVYVGIY